MIGKRDLEIITLALDNLIQGCDLAISDPWQTETEKEMEKKNKEEYIKTFNKVKNKYDNGLFYGID